MRQGPKAKTEHQALKEEEARRRTAIDLLSRQIAGGSSGDFTAEARFYCEEHNYDYVKAKAAYEEDKAFEE